MIDAHCHILPGCDDGSPYLDYSIEMLKTAKNCGFNKIIFTSHLKDQFANFKEQNLVYQQIKPYADNLGIQTQIGTEIHCNKLLEIELKSLKDMTLGNSNLILLEFSLNNMPANWENIIKAIQELNLKVIVAHPERYFEIWDDYSIIDKMKTLNCYLMLSATYINSAILGLKSTKLAKKIIKNGCADFIASDAHSLENYKFIKPAYTWAEKHGFNLERSQGILERAFI